MVFDLFGWAILTSPRLNDYLLQLLETRGLWGSGMMGNDEDRRRVERGVNTSTGTGTGTEMSADKDILRCSV